MPHENGPIAYVYICLLEFVCLTFNFTLASRTLDNNLDVLISFQPILHMPEMA